MVDGRVRLGRLGTEPEPPDMSAVVEAVGAMLPRIDYPELLLETTQDRHVRLHGAHLRRAPGPETWTSRWPR